jgi:hypothetical protein
MLSADIIREVRRLLDEDELSQRSIAARLKVSRGLVGAVAQGDRLPREAQSRWAAMRGGQVYPERCPGCGGMVYLPCRLCSTRSFSARHRVTLEPISPGERPSPRRAA